MLRMLNKRVKNNNTPIFFLYKHGQKATGPDDCLKILFFTPLVSCFFGYG